MDLYAENILDHYRHPRKKESLESPDISHEEANHSCGDSISIALKCDGDCVKEIGWSGTGCAISQAAISILAEDLPENVENLTSKDMYELLGVPIGPRRTKCALLGLHVLKNAMHKLKGEELQSWSETIGDD